MYAIVKSGGKQYRVERGQRLLIERLTADEGASVALEPILYRSEQAVFDKAGLAKVKVTAKVLAHVRGEKLRVFKFKPKRGYRRRTGHRQELTHIEVTEISALQTAPAARAGRSPIGRTRRTETPGETPKPKAVRASKARASETSKAKTADARPAKSADIPKAKEKAKDGS
jgi:large subunit ribosomal protein L21